MEELYKRIDKIRTSKTIKIKPNKYQLEGTQLRYYQGVGVANLYMIKRMVLGDEMGLGKTLETLVTYSNILTGDPDYKLVVVSPNSALYQWQSEVFKFFKDITVQVVEATPIKVNGKTVTGFDSRKHQLEKFTSNNKNILIFNYNTLQTDFDYLEDIFKDKKFMLVFDEATAFKNHETITFVNVREFSKYADRIYALSATIIKNNLLEAWAIFKVVIPQLFPSIENFKRNYCVMKKIKVGRRTIKKIVGYKNLENFKAKIYPYFLGRKTSDVAKDIPSILTKDILLKMLPKQKELYDDLLGGFLDFNKFNMLNYTGFLESEDILSNDDFKEVKYVDKLTSLIYCQQISNSPYTLGFEVESSKEKEIIKILKEELHNEKVVIYSRFRRMVDRLEDLITKKLKIKCTKITGAVKSKDRELNKKMFNTSSECNVMLINSAAKEAVNLQSARHLIFFDIPFSYGDFIQIIGRIRRVGSVYKNVLIHYLINIGSVDEKVLKILSKKEKLFSEVLGESAQGALASQEPLNTDNFISQLYDEIFQKK